MMEMKPEGKIDQIICFLFGVVKSGRPIVFCCLRTHSINHFLLEIDNPSRGEKKPTQQKLFGLLEEMSK